MAHFFDAAQAFHEIVLSREVFVSNKVIDPLPVHQLRKIQLRPAPGPNQIPGSPQIHAMRQLVPVILPQERSCDYVINFLLLFDNSVVEKVRFSFCYLGVFTKGLAH